jgi:hypothetical protein
MCKTIAKNNENAIEQAENSTCERPGWKIKLSDQGATLAS